MAGLPGAAGPNCGNYSTRANTIAHETNGIDVSALIARRIQTSRLGFTPDA